MNACQRLWWEQTASDYEVFRLLREQGAVHCHLLHYLQMATEKLGKAYFWRTGRPPTKKSHASFVKFLQALHDRREPDRTRIAACLGFGRADDLKNWIRTITPLAYALERLAPDLAGDNGPNPEYPWPWLEPTQASASHNFEIWKKLTKSGSGRQLLDIINAAVVNFPAYA